MTEKQLSNDLPHLVWELVLLIAFAGFLLVGNYPTAAFLGVLFLAEAVNNIGKRIERKLDN